MSGLSFAELPPLRLAACLPMKSSRASASNESNANHPKPELRAEDNVQTKTSGDSATSPVAKLQAVFLSSEEAYQAAYGPEEQAALAGLMTFMTPPLTATSWRDHRAAFSGVQAIVTGWDAPKMDADFLKAFPAVRAVFHTGGSVKFFVTDELWDRGVVVTCASHANAVSVAEFTFAHVVLGLKHAWSSTQATRRARRFVRNDAAVPSTFGSTVGIISFGAIGRMVTERLRSLEVRLIGYDPYLSAAEAAALGVELCSLEDVFANADVVTCHTPLLPETTHLLRAHHFTRMKAGATFINTARGGIVHEIEMLDVLSHRPDLFAVLDVTDPEPPAADSPLFTLPNVLLTPHISGSVGRECRRMGRMIVDEIRRYLTGRPLLGEVQRKKLPLLA